MNEGGREGNAAPANLLASLETALAELAGVVGDIVATAEQKSCERCPYMNVRRECTAKFDCINQVFRAERERPICSGQHRINFSRPHSVWCKPIPPTATSP